MNERSKSDSSIQSVQRAAALLHCFTRAEPELSVTALSEQLGLHKSTVSRLLATLRSEELVEQDPESGKYRLGLGLVTLAGIVLDRIDLRSLAYPYLTALADLTRETVTIGVRYGDECMNIGSADSPRPVQFVGRIGRRTSMHSTATGKVLLAHLSPEERRGLLPDPLPRQTSATIVDIDVLDEALTQIKAQGYAIELQEDQEGVAALAAPVFRHDGHVVAAVSVSGPAYRLDAVRINEFISPTRQAADEVSAALGHQKNS